MVIAKKYEDPTVATRQREMDAAKKASMEHCRELAEKRRACGCRKGQGLVGGIHYDALMEAVKQEGPEVLGAAAKGWWDDMKRMNPWMCADGCVPDGNSVNGHRGRHGVVRERFMRGRWWKWEHGEWVPARQVEKKGIR